MRTNRLAVAAVAALSATLLSACGLFGNDDDTAQQPLPPAAAPVAPAASAAAPVASAPAVALPSPNTNGGGYWPARVIEYDHPKLGQIVVDGDGYTLYRFDDDTANPSQSTCSEGCAQKWPPVLTRDTIEFAGIDKDKLGAIARPDGTHQVTVGGWPVYRFMGDYVPGDYNGQGAGGTWFVIDPAGKKASSH